jgi:putative heme-binding domain-containing protein
MGSATAMTKTTLSAVPFLLAVSLLGVRLSEPPGAADPPKTDRPFGIVERVPWTTSRVVGSPDPPPPYRIERAFPKLTFKNPLLLTNAPGTGRLFVGEHIGKLYSFPEDPDVAKADLFLDLTTELHSWDKDKVRGIEAVYGLTFHPQFVKNRYCYVCYVLAGKDGKPLPDGSRVSRFRVTDAEPPRIDPKSEKVVITWLAGGHNGGDIHFGPDGCLYISTGDATDPNPPDRLDTGQDISDLLSSVLRIDVDNEDAGKAYRVPADNPFVKTPGARPEVWAYGFRNPWRMSFDRATGELWVGDVGWERFEMVYRVQKGGNYGWSIMEGPQPVRPEAKRGPTPILPPNFYFPHTEGASITGGYVYRGKRLKDLVGAYVCGDWMTRRVWGTRFDGDRVTWHKELAKGSGQIVAFGQTNDGELYFLNYDLGTVSRLVPSDAKDNSADFPRKLSETGLFASVKAHEPVPGVVPFSINAEQWVDHATSERLLALPGRSSVRVLDRPVHVEPFFQARTFFPAGAVLARTLSMEMERGDPKSRRRLETQLLHFDGTEWYGYSYQWNDEQTDAALVPAAGADRPLTVVDARAPGGKRQQTWHYPGRGECMQCHNPWAGFALAFAPAQIDRRYDYGAAIDEQLRTLEHAGYIKPEKAPGKHEGPPPTPARLCDPYDSAADVNARARSYLHANCAHCHQGGAGGTATIELRFDVPLSDTKTVEARPVQGTFAIHNAQIVAAGDPFRSVLYYRMAKVGSGRMPHVGSVIVDERGVHLIHDWIRQLPVHREEAALLERLRSLESGAAPARAEVIKRLLSNTTGALMLARAVDEEGFPAAVRTQVLAASVTHPEAQVRDLFERFLPDEQRVKRLGAVVKPEQILARKGDAARGKELFFKTGGLQCVNCHRIGGNGSTLGPELTQVGKKYDRGQLLEKILEPSKKVHPDYLAYLAETTDGRVVTGLLVKKTAEEVVLKTVDDKQERIAAGKVERLVPLPKSLMPELLLRDATPEQAADLLEYLASLK